MESEKWMFFGCTPRGCAEHSRALMVALLLGTAGVAAAAAASANFCFEMASKEDADRNGGWLYGMMSFTFGGGAGGGGFCVGDDSGLLPESFLRSA
jgi:hypothetical protein